MYFSHRTSRGRKVLQLLESYRNAEGKPRNRVIASLGQREMDENLRQEVADLVDAELYGRPLLLEASAEAAEEARRIVREVQSRGGGWMPLGGKIPAEASADVAAPIVDGVLVDRVETSETTSLGPELVGMKAWNELGMDELLERLDFNPAQRQAACVQVLGRLIAPGSELALAERFLDGSSLPDLLGLKNSTPISTDRHYRVADRLLENRDAIEKHLRNTVRRRLALKRTYYLYDLTNTHFEGLCEANPKARRGNNKQKRNDCPQIAAGLCFDEHGFVLFHRLFAGNTHDSSTLPDMIKVMQAAADEEGLLPTPPTVILDGGIASEANLKLLREAGLHYLVNRTRSYRRRFAELFTAEEGFEVVPDREVQVRKIPGTDGADDLVLCRSDARGAKETAIRSRADERLLKDLAKLRDRVAQGQMKQSDKIDQAIGRIRERHPRVARYYEISRDASDQLVWTRTDDQSVDALDGCYILQAHGPELSAVDLWRQYMVLTKAEDGFRALKGHLGLRPNYHRLEHRVDGHVFISVLAYQLMRYIMHHLESQGDRRSWPVLRQILQSHCYATVELPTVSGALWRTRRPGKPDPQHRLIYQRLQISLQDLPRHTNQVQTPTPRKV